MSNATVVNDSVKEAMGKLLKELASVEEKLIGKTSKYDAKINVLKAKKVKETKSLVEELVGMQKHLLELAESYEFDGDTKTVRYEIGDVFAKKLPDTLLIPDVDDTIEKLEEHDFDDCIKKVKTIVRKAVENLSDEDQEECGISINPGKDRYYYKINRLKTSTGLVFPKSE